MTLAEAQAECDRALSELEKCFQPHCRLTLIMRNPGSEDGDLVFTRDDLSLVERAIRRLRAKSLAKPK